MIKNYILIAILFIAVPILAQVTVPKPTSSYRHAHAGDTITLTYSDGRLVPGSATVVVVVSFGPGSKLTLPASVTKKGTTETLKFTLPRAVVRNEGRGESQVFSITQGGKTLHLGTLFEVSP